MKAKVSFVLLYLFIFPSINSMGIAFLTPTNTNFTYPLLSSPTDGVSNYNVTESVKYEVVINFSMTHNEMSPQNYGFKVARLNDRQPNSVITQYCPPYQETKLLYNSITGYDDIEFEHLDKFNNTYDLFNTTLNSSINTLTLDQKYNITLNAIRFDDIQNEDIGVYNPGDEIHTLYNVTEQFYECNNTSLIDRSNNIVGTENNTVEKARKIFDWIINNIDYQDQINEIGALEAYNQRSGDCSDFSDIMITLLRIQSIPARKVTGFLITNNPSHNPKVGNKYLFDLNYDGATKSASSANEILGHAWIEYYVPDIGWIACDPTWGEGYFNQIDFLRFNLNIGAWFFLPGASIGYDYTSEFPINPSPICSDHSAYDWEYSIEITVLDTNLAPISPFPIFVVIFIGVGFAVILITSVLLIKRKKEIVSNEF